jgi:dimethylaniline monooxygenase (N-oxide forming)
MQKHGFRQGAFETAWQEACRRVGDAGHGLKLGHSVTHQPTWLPNRAMTGPSSDNLPSRCPSATRFSSKGQTSFRLQNGDGIGITMNSRQTKSKQKEGSSLSVLDHQSVSRREVAIVGSGPGGLVAARYLKAHGFQPVIFEQGDNVGGQWNVLSPHSGVWPSMVTNTCNLLTCFSDLSHAPGTPLYPSNQEMLAYFRRYARHFGILSCVRYNTRVESVTHDPKANGWKLETRTNGSEPEASTFPYVVVASGRFNKPKIPSIPGHDLSFGSDDVIHSFRYKDPGSFRGKRVLVIGCGTSALEIASDLAMLGAARVISTFRHQRYITLKLVAGIPNDTRSTRFTSLNTEVMSKETLSKNMTEYVLRMMGSPEQFGAFKPAGDILGAGRALSQYYLPLVAEGRIIVKPWISEIEGNKVRFSDESSEEVDAVILATGFELNLPFLSADIRNMVDLDAQHIDLYKLTFHPKLPGLSFLGLWEQTGPYLPILELQARWIAYIWSGLLPALSEETMRQGIAVYRAGRGGPQLKSGNRLALMFAREAGIEPDLRQWPELARSLLFGPLTAVSFRLSGPDGLSEAPARIMADARALGTIVDQKFTPEELTRLEALAVARNDPEFSDFVNQIALRRV